jgi:hypothetical protein
MTGEPHCQIPSHYYQFVKQAQGDEIVCEHKHGGENKAVAHHTFVECPNIMSEKSSKTTRYT